MKRIGVFTSGGDAPGMNACIRGVVATAFEQQVEVVGIRYGYQGMIEGDMVVLSWNDVHQSLSRGGTLLKSARCQAFMTSEGRAQAIKQLRHHRIEGLVAIGGDGTFTGAEKLQQESGIAVVGAPGTIDNDLSGTDHTIGFDTAVSTALESLDKIRDTADSHDRVFFVEVMGHSCGHIAIHSGIAGGADYVIAPEMGFDVQGLIEKLQTRANLHRCFLVVVAEGKKAGDVNALAQQCSAVLPGLDIRVVTLGHIQRGGSPTAGDRVLASRLGGAAVQALLTGRSNEMVGVVNNRVCFTAFGTAISQSKPLPDDLLAMASLLCQGSSGI